MATAIAGISGIEPVRGWTPEWYTWAQFGGLAATSAAAGRDPLGGEASFAAAERPIHRKPTAAERMPVDELLLRNNGEISG